MRHDEDKLQERCVTFLTYRYAHLFFNHSPNEGERSPRQGAKLKKMGMQKGYPDLDILFGEKTLHIEFKTPTGRQSQDQKRVQRIIEGLGREYIICRTYEQFVELCHERFGPERDPDVDRLKEILGYE